MLSAAAVYGVTEGQLRATYTVPTHALDVPTDSATVARGAHVVGIRGCADCHTADFGGGVFLDDPLVGTVYASNLTRGRGGIGGTFTAGASKPTPRPARAPASGSCSRRAGRTHCSRLSEPPGHESLSWPDGR